MLETLKSGLEHLRSEIGLAGFAFYYVVIGLFLQMFIILPKIRQIDKTWKDKEHIKERLEEITKIN